MLLPTVLLLLAGAVYLAYRFLWPEFAKSQAAMKRVKTSMKLHQRLLTLLDEDVIHASVGQLYLTEDVEAASTGAVVKFNLYEPMEGLVTLSPAALTVYDLEGAVLFTCPPETANLALPGNFEATPLHSRYFYFELESGHALIAQHHHVLGEPLGLTAYQQSGGSKALAYWDGL